jgi:hypothetical protein
VAINVIGPVGDPRGDLIVGDCLLYFLKMNARISQPVWASSCSSLSNPQVYAYR